MPLFEIHPWKGLTRYALTICFQNCAASEGAKSEPDKAGTGDVARSCIWEMAGGSSCSIAERRDDEFR